MGNTVSDSAKFKPFDNSKQSDNHLHTTVFFSDVTLFLMMPVKIFQQRSHSRLVLLGTESRVDKTLRQFQLTAILA